MIKIYGERNSCNNYLVKLIELNLRVDVNKSHQFPIYEQGNIHIILTKNPYAWLLSLWKKPHGSRRFREKFINLGFDEFIRSEWKQYSNAVERYNDINLKYIDFLKNNKDVLLIKSEDLQRNPSETIAKIAYHYDLKLRPFRNIEKEVNSGGNLVGKYNRLKYYLNEEWRKKLTKEDTNYINKIVSKEIFHYLSYEQI